MAYLNPGSALIRVVVRDELYEMHSRQKNEDTANGNTFFAQNSGHTPDLAPGDIDIEVHVNRVFARDGERKRNVNGGAAYILHP